MKILPLISVLLVSLSGMAQMSGNGISSGASGLGPKVDVTRYGAVGDSTTDNCTALTNASNAALAVSGLLYFPPGKTFATSCTVPFLTNWQVEGTLKAIAGGTAASTALVSTGTAVTLNHVGISGPGTIDGNSLSPLLVWVMQGHHVNIDLANIIGLAVNGKGVEFGDDAGVGAGGNEGFVTHVGFGLSLGLGPGPAGSTCIYISGGNGTQGAFTDDDISHNTLHNCAVGWQDHVGGNNYFSDDHAWDTVMSTCFDEYANGGTLNNEYCDTPSTYGFHIRGTGSLIKGGTAYLGTSGTNNTATAIQFDVPSEPFALVSGIRIYGADSSHKWLADTNLGFNATSTTWCDVRDGSNVTTAQNGTGTCIRNGTQKYFGTLWMGTNAMYTGNPNTFTCSAVCAFAAGNWQKATLSQNATSTFTLVTPGGGTPWTNTTIMICQPATGGPYTFTPPANSAGFGTIGTTAGKCSVQNFVWDGTTLRASSTMQINE